MKNVLKLNAVRQAKTRNSDCMTPPAGMASALVAVWVQTVDALPHDWFSPEQTPVLVAYCAHVARFNQLEGLIATLDPLRDLDQYEKLVKLAGLESAKIGAHARSMRLTQQTRLKSETASNQAIGAAQLRKSSQFDDLIAR